MSSEFMPYSSFAENDYRAIAFECPSDQYQDSDFKQIHKMHKSM